MRKNYKEFADRYAASGLSRKAYAEQEGMSSNMVSYYLKRARDQKELGSSFKQIDIITLNSSKSVIKIITPAGLQIEIPI